MSQLKIKNPQMANQIQGLVNSKGNPMELYHQIIRDNTPQQMEQFYSMAKQWGIPDDVINQVQNNSNNT